MLVTIFAFELLSLLTRNNCSLKFRFGQLQQETVLWNRRKVFQIKTILKLV